MNIVAKVDGYKGFKLSSIVFHTIIFNHKTQ